MSPQKAVSGWQRGGGGRVYKKYWCPYNVQAGCQSRSTFGLHQDILELGIVNMSDFVWPKLVDEVRESWEWMKGVHVWGLYAIFSNLFPFSPRAPDPKLFSAM